MGSLTVGFKRFRGYTKAQIRAALERVILFRNEFAEKPEHSIDLDHWYWSNIKEVQPTSPHCGSVGCVGGYAVHSQLMEDYRTSGKAVKHIDAVYSFFGVSATQCDKLDLLAPRTWRKNRGSDKTEGLFRLDKLIKIHKKTLGIKTPKGAVLVA